MHTTTKRNRCECGRAISKYAVRCDACRSKANARELEIVAAGKCPRCGQGIRRNLSLTGWWQCDGFGADGFRKPGAAKCDWQTFAIAG